MTALNPPPSPEEGLELHRRLCEGDPAAWGDLARAYLPLNSVELSPDAGKYLGREDDPSLRLRIAEEAVALRSSIPAAVLDGLSEAEGRAIELMLAGEWRTRVYAEACGLAHLPWPEQ